MNWVPLAGLAVTLALLLLIERWIHRHLQGTMLLLTGDREIAVVLYALPLMPGILIHELSHALTAKMLGVRVGRISLRPGLENQRIQLGFVPVEKTDVVRASLIGLAPLLAGSTAIQLIGHLVFDIGALQEAFTHGLGGDWTILAAQLSALVKAPDFWLWAYLIFAISNTMLPSRSDRQAWTPVVIFLLLTGVIAWATGLGPAIVSNLNHLFNTAIRWLTVAYALTIMVDVPFALLIALTERVLGRVKGIRVEY